MNRFLRPFIAQRAQAQTLLGLPMKIFKVVRRRGRAARMRAKKVSKGSTGFLSLKTSSRLKDWEIDLKMLETEEGVTLRASNT